MTASRALLRRCFAEAVISRSSSSSPYGGCALSHRGSWIQPWTVAWRTSWLWRSPWPRTSTICRRIRTNEARSRRSTLAGGSDSSEVTAAGHDELLAGGDVYMAGEVAGVYWWRGGSQGACSNRSSASWLALASSNRSSTLLHHDLHARSSDSELLRRVWQRVTGYS